MDKTIKFRHRQSFSDDDYVELKHVIKGKDRKKNMEYRQLPSTFFILFAIMAAISFITKETGTMILYIIGALICMFGVFFVNYIDHHGVFFYKILFAKRVMNEYVFYDDFVECYNEQETFIIIYEQINKVFESENLLFVKINSEEKIYQLISKKDMSKELYHFLKVRFEGRWINTNELENFHL